MNRVVPNGRYGWVAIGASDGDGALWTSKTGKRSWVLQQPEEFDGQRIQDIRSVTRNGNILVAGGTDEAGGDFDGALWRSKGVTWRRVHAGEVLGGPGDQVVITVEPHDDGFVAVGFDEKNGDSDAAVWLSRGGGSWERVPSNGDLAGHGDQVMMGVTSTSMGLVAVGQVTHTDGEIDGAIWTSTNGNQWDLQTSREYASPGGEQQIKWVVAKNGFLVAGGWVEQPGGDLDAAVWRARLPSTDPAD
jgi:hypothetical protein